MRQGNKLLKQSSLLLACSLLAGCDVPRSFLNGSTVDIASNFNSVVEDQVANNLVRFGSNPNGMPSYVNVTSGLFQNTDSIAPTLTLPIGSSLETDAAAAATNVTTAVGATTGSSTSSVANGATSGTKRIAAATSLGLQAMAQWQQSWAVIPSIDPDAVRRQRALYRYATRTINSDCTDKDNCSAGSAIAQVDFVSEYPLQRSANGGVNIYFDRETTTVFIGPKKPNITTNVLTELIANPPTADQINVDPAFLTTPSCAICALPGQLQRCNDHQFQAVVDAPAANAVNALIDKTKVDTTPTAAELTATELATTSLLINNLAGKLQSGTPSPPKPACSVKVKVNDDLGRPGWWTTIAPQPADYNFTPANRDAGVSDTQYRLTQEKRQNKDFGNLVLFVLEAAAPGTTTSSSSASTGGSGAKTSQGNQIYIVPQ